jgi:phosphopantothenoylcysteine decarboxylase / phosphopantothenate---cysteine ligase
MMFKNRTIVLGITGSIAAFKAAELASQFTKAGARVDVVMTESAQKFITPLTFRNITGRPVVTGMWDLASEFSVQHVALSEAADIVIIAPATANIIAKLAAGIADDMLSCTVLATKAPVLIAPAMNDNMYANPVTQQNVLKLKQRGFTFVEPQTGRLASGKTGKGRLTDLSIIIDAAGRLLNKPADLKDRYIVITAGGTQEPLDPVRCLTNYSSGKMGYALAKAAQNRGAKVTLVSAPTSLNKPDNVDVVNVITAEDMFKAVKKATSKADVLIMAAAVADYRPVTVSTQKIKRQTKSELVLHLERTPDILAGIQGKFVRVGFAAESQNLVDNAREKLKKKQLDLIVANDVTVKGSTFGSDNNQVVLIDKKGKADSLPLMPKTEVADKILDKIVKILGSK